MNENETGMTFSLSHFSPLGVTFSLSIDRIVREKNRMDCSMPEENAVANGNAKCSASRLREGTYPPERAFDSGAEVMRISLRQPQARQKRLS